MVDKLMMVRLLEFSQEVTQAFERFDLRSVYEILQRFIVREVSEFYLDFSTAQLQLCENEHQVQKASH